MTTEYDKAKADLEKAHSALKRLEALQIMEANLHMIYRNDPHRLKYELDQLRMVYE